MKNKIRQSRKVTIGFLAATEKVLRLYKRPMGATEIASIAMEKGFLKPNGKTPANTLYSLLRRHIKDYNDCNFKYLKGGLFCLKK